MPQTHYQSVETMSEDRAQAILARLAEIKNLRKSPSWSGRLLQALGEGRVSPFYQPIFSGTGKLVGAEAFVRWKEGERHVAPVELLSEIRLDSQAMEKLTIFMIDRVCSDYKTWRLGGGLSAFKVYLNVSPREFFSLSFAGKVVDLLEMHEIRRGAVAIELSDFAEGVEHINRAVFSVYEAAGIPVCLDNVGRGAASFDLLERMPFSEFKIDRTFTCSKDESAHRRKLAARWVSYAKEKGVRVTLGGIESQDQVDAFGSEPHVHYQGWLFGKDRPAAEFRQAYLI